MKNLTTLIVALLFATLSRAEEQTEKLSYSPAPGSTVEITCKVTQSGLQIRMSLKGSDFKFRDVTVFLSEPHACRDVVSFDTDFDGDGINDIAVNDLSMLPDSVLEIFLVSVSGQRIYSAGTLPIAAIRQRDGSYVNVNSSGGSLYKSRYRIENHHFKLVTSLEKVLSGSVCKKPVKVVLDDSRCKGKKVSASINSPVCINHLGINAPKLAMLEQCNFSLSSENEN